MKFFPIPISVPPRPIHLQRQRGLTLIEACVVLAMLAILVAAVASGMQSLLETRRLEGTATQLASDIQFIRTESVARNQPLRLSFHTNAAGSCYVIHTGAANECRCDAPGPAQCIGTAREVKTVMVADSDNVRLQTNVASVLFDPMHGTSSPTGTLRVIGAHGRAIHHVINIMGRTRSCSPQPAMPGYRTC